MATTTIDPEAIDPEVVQYLHYNIPRLRQMLEDRIGKNVDVRGVTKYKLASAINYFEKKKKFHRFMDLPPELRAEVYHHLFARQSRCGGPICYPQILATSSKVREEAYDIFHGGISNNYEISILLTSEVITVQQSRLSIPANQHHPAIIAIPRRDETYTSAWITVSEDIASRRRVCRRFLVSDMDLIKMADSWPLFVRTAMHLQVTVRLSTQPGFRDFLTDKPFLIMNHLLYSLAHSAQACKKLELRIQDLIHPDTNVPFRWKHVLSGACLFENVQTCKVLAWNKEHDIWEKRTGLARHAYLSALVTNPIASPTSGHDILALHDCGRFLLDLIKRGKLMGKVCAKWPDFRLLEFSLPLLRLYACGFDYLPHSGSPAEEVFASPHPYWKIGMVVRGMRKKNKKHRFRLEEVSKRVNFFSDGRLDREAADEFGVTLSQALAPLKMPAQPVGEVGAHGAHGALGRAKRVFREIKAAAEHRTQ